MTYALKKYQNKDSIHNHHKGTISYSQMFLIKLQLDIKSKAMNQLNFRKMKN